MIKSPIRTCRALAIATLAAAAPAAYSQVATLAKGHHFFLNNGLQIWGLDQGASNFTYNNLTNANFNGVVWSWGQAGKVSQLQPGQKWGKWTEEWGNPALALNALEMSRMSDLLALQVGDEQQGDLEDPNGHTKTWFQNAHAGNYFPNQLLYVNSFYIITDAGYANFIAAANPDAISFDSYPLNEPYGSVILPHNWLSLAGRFRRHALGSYIGVSNNAARPYGMYLQTYAGTEGAGKATRHPGDVEMRWQQFTAWTMGFSFVDAFTVGGASSLFNGGSMASPWEPRYSQFAESARQSRNLGPALTKLISYGYGPSIVVGANSAGAPNPVPGDWLAFNKNNAPPSQQYLNSVSATNTGTKNNGQPGDVYVGFFNPLHTDFGPASSVYFMVTNALGAYLDDPTATVADCQQQLAMSFDTQYSGVSTLQRLRRSDGQLEIVPLAHTSARQYQYQWTLEGGTGDLFKYNDGSPFVGVNNTLYWDNDGIAIGNNTSTGAGMGGSGAWDGASSKWYNGSANGAWAGNRDAIFWGSAGTVTLTAPQSVNSLSFKSNGYTITGSTLTMAGQHITTASGVSATIASTVAGTGGIIKAGPGTLVLSNTANTYTGGTTITGGVLQISADSTMGLPPGGFTAANIILNGGTLKFGADVAIHGNRGIALGPSGGMIDTGAFNNGVAGYNAFQGGFTGPGDLTKLGSGTFFAAATTGGANTTWKGRLILKQGTWKIAASDGLPYNPPAGDGLQAEQVTLDGGTWLISTNNVNNTLSVTNARRGITVAAGGGTIDTQHHTFAWAGPLAGSHPAAVLNKVGSGTLNFTSPTYASTYAGAVNVNAGTLQLSNGNAMGDLASINLASSGTVLNITGNETIGSLAGVSGSSVTLGAVTFTTGGNNNSTTFAGAISGSGNLVKTGGGAMTLSGSKTHNGATTINGGTLTLNGTGATTWNNNVAVSAGTLTVARTGGAVAVAPGVTFTVSPGATLQLAGSLAALSDGTVHANVENSSTTSLNVLAGDHAAGNVDGIGNTTVAADASFTVNRIRQNSVAVDGTVTLRSGGAAGASDVTTVSLGAAGKLNVNDGKLITQSSIGAWDGSDYSGLTGLIKSGRNNGTWDGARGIVTHQPLALSQTTTIAIAAASDIGRVGTIFGGVTLEHDDIMLMYTYAGDANLSGDIDGDDFFRIDASYSTAATGYSNGDFNYDGRIDADDYFLIDQNYARQGAAFSSAMAVNGVTTVPEPAVMGALMLMALARVGRRQRRNASSTM